MNITRYTISRFAFDALVIALVLFSPWFISLVVALIGVLIFKGWYDVALIALFYDALYDPHPFAYIGLFGIALVIVALADIVRVLVRPKDDHKLHFK